MTAEGCTRVLKCLVHLWLARPENLATLADLSGKQLAAAKGRTYEEALTHLLNLMKQGWAAQGK